ncbi:MAG TPA: prepilin-type N-terminal cleavage/methylation domain-containing protein [Candidatus Omnitrophota bacterium]|nr:prepilin-type N-terminal cleavage/methylation domain-containing protein [Candidatus Omnitrophota bacterium]HPS36415.1 prepilin-type N-terminal cleavage/methylation domain-containing protein [Candidatus Omnitrophota bacterium]
MDRRGMSLLEVMVSFVLLAILALGITSMTSLMSGDKRRSPSGSFDLQATHYARGVLENLRNAVSAQTAAGQTGAPLVDSTASCSGKAFGMPCGSGTEYTNTALTDLPAGVPLLAKGGARKYKVWDVADGNGGVAYKKVTATVTWND